MSEETLKTAGPSLIRNEIGSVSLNSFSMVALMAIICSPESLPQMSFCTSFNVEC